MIIKHPIWITPYETERLLHIYIPDNLKEGEKCPCLYMFDGHNLFFDEDATFGTSWGIKDYLDKHHTKLVVVGLECNHDGNERLSEFTPLTYIDDVYGPVEQKGLELIRWMKTELREWCEAELPIRPGRKNTYIGGSSMGGTMSLWMAINDSDVYSRAICVSPHIYPMFKDFKKTLNARMRPGTQVYISWGGQEYNSSYTFRLATDQNMQIIRALLKKPGVQVVPYVFKNDNHSERAWRKELPIWMKEIILRK